MSLETIADKNYSGTQSADSLLTTGKGFAAKANRERRIKSNGNEDKTPDRSLMFPPFGIHVPNVPRDAQGFRKQRG